MKPPWFDEAAAKLAELNSAKEIPFDQENLQFALRLLEETCTADTPMPFIALGYDGEVIISWDFGNIYIEFYINEPNEVEVWRQTPETKGAGGEEFLLVNDYSLAADWLMALPLK